MYFFHAQSVWTEHSTLRALVVVIDGVQQLSLDQAREERLVRAVEQRLASAAESEMPELKAWRDAFSKMGLKPTQYRCAAEALLRRYRKERVLPRLHPLVDHLNHLSMSFAIPIAAFDLSQIAGGISVRSANGAETYHSFQGETESPSVGEIIFSDERNWAHSRRWTFRQSAVSAVQAHTCHALVVAEALHEHARGGLAALGEELSSWISGGRARVLSSKLLDPSDHRLDFTVP